MIAAALEPDASSEPCVACAGREARFAWRVPGRRAASDRSFDYLRCETCGTVFLSRTTPAPNDIYTKSYFADGGTGPLAAWTSFCFFLRRARVPSAPPGARLLEIGFGGGAWMEDLSRHGWDVHGLDPSTAACDAARKRGLKHVSQGTAESHQLEPGGFRVVMAVHCMEHDRNPRAFLAGAAALVARGGWLGIAIPDVTSWEARRAGPSWFHLDPPYHQSLPPPDWVCRRLRELDFTAIRVERPIAEYAQSLLYALARRPPLPSWLTLAALPFALVGNAAMSAIGRSGVVEIWARRPL